MEFEEGLWVELKVLLAFFEDLLYNVRRRRRQKSIGFLCFFDAFCSQNYFRDRKDGLTMLYVK